jgi:Flp pilus assembly protein TadB
MKLKRVIGVVGLVAVYCGPGLFFIFAVALGVNICVALFITLGMVIVIRFVLNIDF